MRLLDIARWRPAHLGYMPHLQSLRLGNAWFNVVPLNELALLKMLFLCRIQCTSVLRHSQSLTTLMLDSISFVNEISGPVTFPSLTYLSLFSVRGFKPHIIAPCLVTYHEGGSTGRESFNISVPSLVEYGVYHPSASSPDPAEWHLSFPNILRLSLRADELVLLSFLTSLAIQPQSLPALQTISAGGIRMGIYQISEVVQANMESLVLVRNEACDVDVVLYFETGPPFQIPIFRGKVIDLFIRWFCALLMHPLGTGLCPVNAVRSRVLPCSHSPPKL
jgi:hypothetical protein